MDVDLVRRLASGAGRQLLESLPPYREADVAALDRRLRREGHPPALVAAALTQARLRARATAKLGERAGQMLLTDEGLEQATRAEVADRHAAVLAAAGARSVWDLGCGIGADAVAFARAGLAVRAVEADPVTAAVARANLAPWPSARVQGGRAEEVALPDPVPGDAAVWLDPSRRRPGVRDVSGARARRLFRLGDLSPSWDTVRALAARFPVAGAKLSPGFPRREVPPDAAVEWVSVGGEVVECVLWWGVPADGPACRAVVRHGDRWITVTASGGPGDTPVLGRPVEVGDWLYEPDKAVLQAGLLCELSSAVDGGEVDPGVGYVVGRRGVDLPWARRFEVLDVLPAGDKRLRSWARAQGLAEVTVKKRGVGTDTERLRRQLLTGGTRSALLVLTRAAGRTVALHVTPAAGR